MLNVLPYFFSLLPGRYSGQDLRIDFRDETVQGARRMVAARGAEHEDRKVALFSHLPLSRQVQTR